MQLLLFYNRAHFASISHIEADMTILVNKTTKPSNLEHGSYLWSGAVKCHDICMHSDGQMESHMYMFTPPTLALTH